MILDDKRAAAANEQRAAATTRRAEVERLREKLATALCQGSGIDTAMAVLERTQEDTDRPPVPEAVAEYLNRIATRLAVLLVGEDLLIADDEAIDAANETGAHTD